MSTADIIVARSRSAFKQFMRGCQIEIREWLCHRIGIPSQFESLENRSQRFFEEATELVQVTGLTREQCHELVDYVYNRPVGQLHQEIGGVMVCLAALSERLDENMGVAFLDEIERVHKPEIIEKVRAAIERKRRDGVGI
jgi:NTP pyrophosphatase (non-canonical NTP hydrolase)